MASKTAVNLLADKQENDLSPARRNVILFTLVLATTLHSSTILMVSTILPQLQGAMSATADEMTWTMTFNILAIAVTTPMAGWLVARLGQRRVMMWSVVGFSIATYLCGTSDSLAELIFWRFLQGALSAPIVPVSQSIMLDTFPKRQHAFAIGMFGIGVVIGAFIGPVISGIMAETYSWRWAFYIMPPFGVVALIGLSIALPKDKILSEATPLDWTGFVLLSITIACMQLVLSRGQRLDWYDSNEIILATFVAGLCGYLFIVHSLTAKKPFINLSLLMNRNYSLGLVLVFIYGMLNFTPMVVLPTLMRGQLGYPDALIGYVLGSRGLGAMFGFFLAIYVGQKYPRKSLLAGFFLLVVAGAWLMRLDLNVTTTELILNGILQGLATGIVWVPLTATTFSTLPPAVRTETSAVFHLFRNIGSSFFISLLIAEVVRSTAMNYQYMTEFVTPFTQTFTMPWVSGEWNTGSVESLTRLSKEMARQAAMISYLNAFGLYTLVAAAAIPLVLLVSKPQTAQGKNTP